MINQVIRAILSRLNTYIGTAEPEVILGNMAVPSTPGVYIDKVPKLPPSVIQVETAIPAFIGFTQVTESNDESWLNKPVSAPGTFFRMYYALQLYFANGGDPCYMDSRPGKKQGAGDEGNRHRTSFILNYLRSGVHPWNSPYESNEQLKNDLLHLLKSSGCFLRFIIFLEQRSLPWKRGGREITDFRDDFTRELLKLLASDMNAMKRLLYLVSEKKVLPVLMKKAWNKGELRKIRKNWNTIFQLAGLPQKEYDAVFLQALSLLHERRENRSLTLSENVSQEIVRVLEVWHKPIFKKLPEVLEKHVLFPGKHILAFRKNALGGSFSGRSVLQFAIDELNNGAGEVGGNNSGPG